MQHTKKHFIFIKPNIDGAMSYLVFQLLSGKRNIPYKIVSQNNFASVYSKANLIGVDHVYVLGIDVSNNADIIDKSNVVIIDNKLHSAKYNNATCLNRAFSSCSKLIYELLYKKFENKLTEPQKLLLLMVDDNESYTFGIPGSYELGLVYGNYQGDKAKSFLLDFCNGFTAFKTKHNNTISYYRDKLHKIKTNLKVYEAYIPIKNKTYKFVSTFTDSFINEIADYITTKYRSDVSMIINTNHNKVSFRRQEGVDLHLGELAEKLASGGGHPYSAGGDLTQDFLR